jgi:hypothetical protein
MLLLSSETVILLESKLNGEFFSSAYSQKTFPVLALKLVCIRALSAGVGSL